MWIHQPYHGLLYPSNQAAWTAELAMRFVKIKDLPCSHLQIWFWGQQEFGLLLLLPPDPQPQLPPHLCSFSHHFESQGLALEKKQFTPLVYQQREGSVQNKKIKLKSHNPNYLNTKQRYYSLFYLHKLQKLARQFKRYCCYMVCLYSEFTFKRKATTFWIEGK